MEAPQINTKEKFLNQVASSLIMLGKVFIPEMMTAGTPPFHYDLERHMRDFRQRSLVVVAPRGHAKSSVAACLYIIWHIFLEDRWRFMNGGASSPKQTVKHIVLISKTRSEAIKRLDTVKAILGDSGGEGDYSKGLRKTFGNWGYQTAKKWTGTEVILKDGTILTALSTGTQARGLKKVHLRPTAVVCHKKGTLVWGADGRLVPVEKIGKRQADKLAPVIRVRVAGVPDAEHVTLEHRFWAKKKVKYWTKGEKGHRRHWRFGEADWVEAQDLTSDHWIGDPVVYNRVGAADMEPVHTFTGGNDITSRCDKGRVTGVSPQEEMTVPEFFDDPEWWWVYGLWLGDGTIGGSRVSWSCSNDVVMDRLSAFWIKWGHAVHYDDRQGCTNVIIRHAAIARWLKTQKGGNSIKNPPEWIYHLEEAYLKELIVGYIDADGWVKNTEVRPCIRLTSVNKEGLYRLSRALSRLGIPSYVRRGVGTRFETFSDGSRMSVTQPKYDLYMRDGVDMLGYDIAPTTRYKIVPCMIEEGHTWRQVKDAQPDGSAIVSPITTEGGTYSSPIGLSHNCDDPEDENNTKTEGSMDANRKWLLQAITPSLNIRTGRVIVIGTPINTQCMVVKLQEATGWRVLWYKNQATDNTSTWYDSATREWTTKEGVLWPNYITRTRLLEEKSTARSLGMLSSYYREWEALIIGDEDQIFRLEYLQEWRGTLERDAIGQAILVVEKRGSKEFSPPMRIPVLITTGVDPAASTAVGADSTAVVNVGTDKDDNIYILTEGVLRRLPPDQVVISIAENDRVIKPFRGLLEVSAAFEYIWTYLVMNHKVVYMKDKPTQKKKGEGSRLESLQPLFASLKVYLPEGFEEGRDQLLAYPRGKDDWIDALEKAVRIRSTPWHTEVTDAPEAHGARRKMIDPMTV